MAGLVNFVLVVGMVVIFELFGCRWVRFGLCLCV